MDLLNDFNPADPISQVLRVIRIRSTVYCRSDMGAPWGFGVRAHGNPAFHVVTSGGGWLQVEGEPAQLALAAGDLVVLPAGPRHWMRDDPATPATELEDILAAAPPLAAIATRAGYGSEFSFGKAFKRTFGIAPGTYRGQPSRVPGLSPAPDTAAWAR
jgi:hypothetical protein